MAIVNWGFIYNPRVVIGSTHFEMPQPISTSSERYGNRMTKTEVPLLDGVSISGITRGALSVTFNGIISKNTVGGLIDTKSRMQDIFIGASGQSFTFYRYYDAGRRNYRWFENCVCESLGFDMESKRKFTLPYQLTIVVPDGKEHQLVTTTGETPGVGSNHSGTFRNGGYQGDTAQIGTSNSTLPDDRQFLFGPLLIRLSDSAGASAFAIRNSDGDILFRVRSDGVIQTISPVELVTSIPSVL